MTYPNHTIEELLHKFQPVLGADYEKYRNHVYRVFLACLLMDDDPTNTEKYAIAAVFHDIGIWTDHTIDYLDPSIAGAKTWLNENGKAAWSEEIALMIHWHHKPRRYRGIQQQLVENFRKADWIDVSLGLSNFGVDKHQLQYNRKQLPNRGFHLFLLKKLGRNFFRHPLKPLPMFRL